MSINQTLESTRVKDVFHNHTAAVGGSEPTHAEGSSGGDWSLWDRHRSGRTGIQATELAYSTAATEEASWVLGAAWGSYEAEENGATHECMPGYL